MNFSFSNLHAYLIWLKNQKIFWMSSQTRTHHTNPSHYPSTFRSPQFTWILEHFFPQNQNNTSCLCAPKGTFRKLKENSVVDYCPTTASITVMILTKNCDCQCILWCINSSCTVSNIIHSLSFLTPSKHQFLIQQATFSIHYKQINSGMYHGKILAEPNK